MGRGMVQRLIAALLVLFGMLVAPIPAFSQGVPNSATVVSSCGTPPSSYTPGQNQPVLQDTSGRTCINSASGTVPNNVVRVPSTSSSAGIVPTSTTVVASSLVAKASPGNLHGIVVTADSTLSAAAWWVMVFNATSLPSNGTVTPAFVWAVPQGALSLTVGFDIPAYLGTGAVIGVSTTGPYSLTASAHAAISALVE